MPQKAQPELELRLHYRQGLALNTRATEVLYGGAAGGGKSHLMRAAAIIWCLMVPGLQVYLFRRTVKDLQKNHFEGPTSFPSLLWPLIQAGFVRIVKNEIRFRNGPGGTFLGGSKIFLNHCEHETDADNYRGYEFHVLLVDELTHFTERQYRMLQSRVRMTEDFKRAAVPEELRDCFPRILCGSNPGGVGHHFAKRHWCIGETVPDPTAQGGRRYLKPMEIHRTPPENDKLADALKDLFPGEPLELRPRQFIPAKLADNPTLDPREYAATLVGLGDPIMIRAMLDGDWKAIVGAMFGESWRDHRHICPYFEIPGDWPLWRGADDGLGNPHCTLWGTRDPQTTTVYVVGELYGPNMLPAEVASHVKHKDTGIQRADGQGGIYPHGEILTGILDSSAWDRVGVNMPSTEKVSRGDQMNALGLNWRPCKKWTGCREAGWQNIHRLLAPNKLDGGLPGLRVFPECKNLIRQISTVMRDLKNPEDIADNQEDHACDALRYLLQYKDGGFSLMRVG